MKEMKLRGKAIVREIMLGTCSYDSALPSTWHLSLELKHDHHPSLGFSYKDMEGKTIDIHITVPEEKDKLIWLSDCPACGSGDYDATVVSSHFGFCTCKKCGEVFNKKM